MTTIDKIMSTAQDRYYRRILGSLPTQFVHSGSDADLGLLSPEGAFPGLTAKLLGLKPLLQAVLIETTYPFPSSRLAEEDLALSEWYFDDTTIAYLGEQLKTHPTGPPILIGCPTVAHYLAASGVSSILVDPSPWLRPNSSITHLRSSASEIDLHITEGSIVVVDPPWHLECYHNWLNNIVERISPGSVVLLVLPQPLSFASAEIVRSFAMNWASSIGDFEMLPSAVRYSTPYFERSILSQWFTADRITNWRQGDLLKINVTRRGTKAAMLDTSRLIDTWEYIRVGRRVIRLDHSIPSGGPLVIGSKLRKLTTPSLSEVRKFQWNVLSSNGLGGRVFGGRDRLRLAIRETANRSPLDGCQVRTPEVAFVEELIKDTHDG